MKNTILLLIMILVGCNKLDCNDNNQELSPEMWTIEANKEYNIKKDIIETTSIFYKIYRKKELIVIADYIKPIQNTTNKHEIHLTIFTDLTLAQIDEEKCLIVSYVEIINSKGNIEKTGRIPLHIITDEVYKNSAMYSINDKIEIDNQIPLYEILDSLKKDNYRIKFIIKNKTMDKQVFNVTINSDKCFEKITY